MNSKKNIKPSNYVPDGSWLTFIRQTVFPKHGSTGNIVGKNKAMAIYRCKCGIEIETGMYNVKAGTKRSCGCIRKHIVRNNIQNITHGLSKHPLYRIFYGIRARCYNKNSNRYNSYGAKGVVICDEWLKDVRLFIKWAIDNGWVNGLQIDKDIIPEKLGIPALLYSPTMCSIVTPKENSKHKKFKMYEFRGENKTLTDWSVCLGIKRDRLYRRLSSMSIDDAFEIKLKKRKHYKFNKLSKKLRLITYKNKTQSLIQWCRELKITPATFYGREKTGNTSLDYLLAPNKRPTVSEKLRKSK